ncbi:hypothetical protein, partial [Porphyromonas sp. CAG:1061]|uniref:hypothetical protein n=1 Tax=Porphyromonas sp. CAG:1061 TaxID=1262916 RepID=UPI0025863347
ATSPNPYDLPSREVGQPYLSLTPSAGIIEVGDMLLYTGLSGMTEFHFCYDSKRVYKTIWLLYPFKKENSHPYPLTIGNSPRVALVFYTDIIILTLINKRN